MIGGDEPAAGPDPPGRTPPGAAGARPPVDPAERWAHRVDPDLAAERAGRGPAVRPPPPPARPFGTSRYAWFAGVVAILLLAYIALNTLRTSGIGGGVPPGRVMPPFAVPLAAGDLEGAANLAARPGPGAGSSGRRPACAIVDPRVLNLCAVAGRAPLVLAFATEQDAGSVAQLDAMQRVARASPDVRFAAVMAFGNRDRTRALVAAHRWSFPVGFDRSGDVLAAYGIPAVPALTLAYRGRRVMREVFSTLDEAELSAAVRALRAGPRPGGAPALTP